MRDAKETASSINMLAPTAQDIPTINRDAPGDDPFLGLSLPAQTPARQFADDLELVVSGQADAALRTKIESMKNNPPHALLDDIVAMVGDHAAHTRALAQIAAHDNQSRNTHKSYEQGEQDGQARLLHIGKLLAQHAPKVVRVAMTRHHELRASAAELFPDYERNASGISPAHVKEGVPSGAKSR